jgi:hypothetical protein
MGHRSVSTCLTLLDWDPDCGFEHSFGPFGRSGDDTGDRVDSVDLRVGVPSGKKLVQIDGAVRGSEPQQAVIGSRGDGIVAVYGVANLFVARGAESLGVLKGRGMNIG